MKSSYRGSCVVLTTKHAKSFAVAPPFRKWLQAEVVEWAVDTDTLGTFSGEVERVGNALECVRRKCEWGVDCQGAEYGLANEGSFGPHPLVPLLPCDQEILYFIDRKRKFHLHLVQVSNKTNYQMQSLNSMEELQQFALVSKFPSHALILRPNSSRDKKVLFKGVNSQSSLEEAFHESFKQSDDGKVWVETDMRAQMNPSRMAVIGELADKLAQRLATCCPACDAPGWGCVRFDKGLRCEYCDQPTTMVAHEVFGCVLCEQIEKLARSDGLKTAPQMYCGTCNP